MKNPVNSMIRISIGTPQAFLFHYNSNELIVSAIKLSSIICKSSEESKPKAELHTMILVSWDVANPVLFKPM